MVKFLLRRTLPRTKIVLMNELRSMVEEHESLSVAAAVFPSFSYSFSYFLTIQY